MGAVANFAIGYLALKRCGAGEKTQAMDSIAFGPDRTPVLDLIRSAGFPASWSSPDGVSGMRCSYVSLQRSYWFMLPPPGYSGSELTVFAESAQWGYPFRTFRRVWNVYGGDSCVFGQTREQKESRCRAADVLTAQVDQTVHVCWSGAMANTAIYGGGLGLMAMSPFVIRRLRARPGQCTRCQYPIVGLPRCPECGLDVLASASSSPQMEAVT